MVMKLQTFMIKIPNVEFNNTCLLVISLDSALKKDESNYLKVFSKSINTFRKK